MSGRRPIDLIPYLAIWLLVFLVVVFAYALAENLRVVHRWVERPYLFVFPAIGVIAALVAAESVRIAAMACRSTWSR